MTAIEDLYLVQNGVNDVVDQDHNTLVDAANYLNDTLGGVINFGNGIEGNLKVGVISAPTATDVAVPTSNETGYLTGTFYYKYSLYNLSGETAVVNASSTVTVAAKNVKVTIPAQASNTNVTGFYIYRSTDDITYYRVGFIAVDDVTSGATEFIDNNPITSGTAPAGASTSTSATISGKYFCKTLTLLSGQTINIEDTDTGTARLSIIATDIIDIQSGSTISGTGAKKLRLTTQPVANSTGNATTDSGVGQGLAISGQTVLANSTLVFKTFNNCFGKNGMGTDTTSYAGGSLALYAKNRVNLNGTFTLNGSSPSVAGSGGGAGMICVCSEIIDKTGITANLNGGNSNGTYHGGGGGLYYSIANSHIGSGTINVNAGTTGGSTNTGGGSGGASDSVGIIIEGNLVDSGVQEV